jgi:dipeptidyl aminopeptidase/acylaminoacyl peptidase
MFRPPSRAASPGPSPRPLALRAVLVLLAVARPLAAQAPFDLDDVLDLRNAVVADVSDDGRWVLVTTSSLRDRIGIDNHRFGDPTYIAPGVADIAVIDTRTGESRPLFREKRQIRGARFSPDGARLAFLLRDGDWFRLAVWERATGRLRTPGLPRGRIIAENAALQWTDDGTRLLVATRDADWLRTSRARFDHEVKGPIVVQSSRDPFLSWEAIRRLGLEQALHIYDTGTGRFEDVLPSGLWGSYALSGDGALLRYAPDITEKTDYAQIFGSETGLRVRTLPSGEDRELYATTRGMTAVQWSGDGRSFVYVKDDRVYHQSADAGGPRAIAGPDPAARDTAPPARAPRDPAADSAARAERARQRFTPVRLSHDGATLIATNSEGFWFIDTATGERVMFQAQPPEEDRTAPRWSLAAWSRDGNDVYLAVAARDAWDRGIHRYDRRTGRRTELVRGTGYWTGLQPARDGSAIVYSYAEANRPNDVWVADANLAGARRLTDANPQLRERRLGATRLIDYLDVDGNRLHGVLYLPPDWVEGTRVPTIMLVYETFFDDRFNATIAYLNAHGYAVMQPSVRFEQGYPGEAWLKGVTAAANRLIELGIADADRLGVQGTSYGGYATSLLVTQTNRFRAAINISGKTNMISFYTDSPRLGTRNIHAPERSQDRIGATLWEQPHKYIAHSAVMAADRVKTPILFMTGQQDHNVTERTTMEMYYALRRLGAETEWVSYINGGHGMPTSTLEEVADYHQRIIDWYGRHLKADAARADGAGGGRQ